jgi:trk system potassium uptake protein
MSRARAARRVFIRIIAGWTCLATLVAVPYLFAGWSLGDAAFEAVSGVTTTAATTVVAPEGLPSWLLFHRSLSQWLGGAAVLVMGAVALPYLGLGGLDAFRGVVRSRTEDPTSAVLRRVGIVYGGLTFGIGVSYLAAGMPAFDAVCHALTTASTGGLSTRAQSFGAFGAPVQWVAIVAMLASGASLTAYWRLLHRRRWLQGPELRWYLTAVAVAAALVVVWNALDGGVTVTEVRHSLFMVSSVMSTTGYWVTGIGDWTAPAQAVLLLLMAVGGMAGSVSGGLRVDRVVALLSYLRRDLAEQLHPRAVRPVRVGRQVVDEAAAGAAAGFAIVYGAVSLTAILLLASTGTDLLTAASLVQSSIANVGPGLGAAAPPATAASLGPDERLVLAGVMIAGRLEVLPVLLALSSVLGWSRRRVVQVLRIGSAR